MTRTRRESPASPTHGGNPDAGPCHEPPDSARPRWRLPLTLSLPFLLLGATLLGIVPPWAGLNADAAPPRTVADRIDEFGEQARARLLPHFERAGVAWPGQRVALVGIKDEDALELHVMGAGGDWRAVRRYAVLAASGVSGPKLREGDFQVPEGIYRVSFLNANSRFHVSLRLDYPNAFDRIRAREDGRSNLGGDIMIHGGRASVGCLAMGDPVAEELFTLAADVGMHNVEVLLLPSDFRQRAPRGTTEPPWIAGLYGTLHASVHRFQPIQ